ncbi:Ankyrin repeat family protein [Prunus dulcis]|uniref:Ankyrin repeat family protein n=1 Tax=Prunus dulcis TaxID=3755 RepID=A0A4Y1QNC7_PRUDU|nr:Ankyrin repeat family protein [Prunus dulcis]
MVSKPSAFKSSSRLGLIGLIVEELKEESYKYEACLHNEAARNNSKYPENYETCMNFAGVLRSFFQVLTNTRGNQNWMLCSLLRANGGNKNGKNAADDEENPQQRSSSVIKASPEASSSAMRLQSKEVSDAKSSRSTDGTNQPHEQGRRNYSYPPNYASLVLFFKLMMKAMLIILGIGIWKIKKIQERKERHIWANQVMNELVQRTSLYKYQNTGQNPHQPNKDKEECDVPNPILLDQAPSSTADHVPSKGGNKNVETNLSSSNQNKYQIESDQNQPAHDYELGLNNGKERKDNKPLGDKKNGNCEADKKQTPLLIAAKMGVTEMVRTILDKFPVAIQDVDSDNKNVVLLAVENRQPHVYNLLRKRKILKESLLRQLDNQGNSALHLAARCGQYRPWLIPGAALQMQWEIKWYKFVKSSMPHGFFVRYNKKGQTPKEIFINTHQNLIKEGSKWLTKTSESCSVVAALIATVAFATSATVPGGLNENTGEPILKDESAFGAFTISSLTALCFSVTSLIRRKRFFNGLASETFAGSNITFRINSFHVSLILHRAYLCPQHQLRYVAYPLYAATCLPVTFFALAQLPLYFDLMRAIIRKVPQRSYECDISVKDP